MKFSFTMIQLAMSATVMAAVAHPLEGRSTCSTPEGSGICQSTSSCTTQGFSVAGYCPGASDIQCCVKKTCSTTAGAGICMNTRSSCPGAFHSGACPGDSSIECCVRSSTGGGGSSSSGGGSLIVSAAQREEGLPYVWGGGGCSGPSGGGFDCSGLTQYSVCKAIGKTIPRTAQTQYSSSMGKHLPRAGAQPGDMIFWATNGDCANRVAHVGIFIRPGWMVNAAHTGTPVREQSIWTSSGGEVICPDAVRFW